MSTRKAENGIDAIRTNDITGNRADTLLSLLTQYVQTENKQMWHAARIWAKATGMGKYLGYLPYSVEKTINNLTSTVYDEMFNYYTTMEQKLGFIPFNVRNRWLKDVDDGCDKQHIQSMALAKTKANSVERFLKKQYQQGQWDGTADSIPYQYQKHQEIMMEGNYGYDQYRTERYRTERGDY